MRYYRKGQLWNIIHKWWYILRCGVVKHNQGIGLILQPFHCPLHRFKAGVIGKCYVFLLIRRTCYSQAICTKTLDM